MKMKDIQVGVAYAIAAPNQRYGTPIRGMVTQKGVHGSVRGSWHRSKSAHPNYVEFEYSLNTKLDTKDSGYGANTYRTGVLENGDIPGGGLRAASEPTREVFRCLTSHILRTWGEESIRRDQQARFDLKEATREANRKQRHDDICARFEAAGFHARGRPSNLSGSIEFDIDDAEKLMDALQRTSLVAR